MKITDLMIGNWVRDRRGGMPLRVNPFMAAHEVSEWEPMPLTTKMLTENGFWLESTKYKDRYRCNFDGSKTFAIVDFHQHVILTESDNGMEVCRIERRPDHTLAVHELQQAMYYVGIRQDFVL